eukprot:scaffold8107_cov363-Prasinococcus_capsulatus_cf.AAC.2
MEPKSAMKSPMTLSWSSGRDRGGWLTFRAHTGDPLSVRAARVAGLRPTAPRSGRVGEPCATHVAPRSPSWSASPSRCVLFPPVASSGTQAGCSGSRSRRSCSSCTPVAALARRRSANLVRGGHGDIGPTHLQFRLQLYDTLGRPFGILTQVAMGGLQCGVA